MTRYTDTCPLCGRTGNTPTDKEYPDQDTVVTHYRCGECHGEWERSWWAVAS